MTKKTLYWLDRNFITFATANKLQNKINSDNYAIIDDVEDQKNFFSNQSLINFKKIWHFTDFVQVKNTEPDLKLLQKLEQKYSLNFWYIAYTERLFYPKVNLYNKYDKNQILSLFQQECEFFEKILDEIKPDYLIISVITQQHMFLMYQICKAKGIPVLTMEPMHFGGKWLITSTIDSHIDINDYEKFSSTSKKSFVDLQNSLKEYKPLVQGHKDVTRYQTSKIAKVKAVSNFLVKSNSEEKHFAVFGKTKSSVFTKGMAKTQQYKKNKRKEFIDKNLIKEIDPSDKIIYYALSYEPEKAMLLGSPFYTNQIALISNIAKSIPVEYTLYVKEHPGMDELGWRDIFYYEQLLDLPNVKLIHPSLSNEELIKKCFLAITIRGTLGLEAAFYEKPSINFNSNSGYSELPSVYTISNIEELPEAIRNSLQIKVNPYDVNKYFDYVNKISFDFNYTDFSSEFAKKFNLQVGYLHKAKISPDEMSSFLKEYDATFELIAEEFVKKIDN